MDDFIKQIETQCYQFLWDDKPDKIKRIQITQSFNKGGLQMINITNFIKSRGSEKISWFRTLVNNSDNPWIYLLKKSVAPIDIDTISQLRNFKIKQLPQNSKNKFWQSALYALYDYIHLSRRTTEYIKYSIMV